MVIHDLTAASQTMTFCNLIMICKPTDVYSVFYDLVSKGNQKSR